ncbi:hypothetical protein CFP56_031973 [Quercus suber]|uniref:Uncharacterized protein n=1 Tax=Quercus suber TaxID=58331 RepID=A0AAW0JIE2_QUESU
MSQLTLWIIEILRTSISSGISLHLFLYHGTSQSVWTPFGFILVGGYLTGLNYLAESCHENSSISHSPSFRTFKQ